MVLTTGPKRRINVTFPADLLAAVDSVVPARKRTQFIVAATEDALRRLELARAIDALREDPAWTEEYHPELTDARSADRYVREMRGRWLPRTWNRIEGEEQPDG